MKALGIIALVLAVVAIFIPGASLFVTWIALALAAIAATSHEATVFVWLTMLVGALNTLLLSPVTLATLLAAIPLLFVTLVLFAAPIAVYMLKAAGYLGGASIRMIRH